MDKLGSFVPKETYTILTWSQSSLFDLFKIRFWRVNSYIKVKFDVWHFPMFASRRTLKTRLVYEVYKYPDHNVHRLFPALVASIMLGPRLGRWEIKGAPPMGSPTNALIGLFMLWWGWLAFNSGSTFGVTGNKWRLAAKESQSLGSVVVLTAHSTRDRRFESLLGKINNVKLSFSFYPNHCKGVLLQLWGLVVISSA